MPALPTLPYNPLRKQHLRDIDSPSPRRNKEGADVRTRKRSEPKRPLYPIDKSNIESPRDNTAIKRKVKALYSNTTSPFFDVTGEAPRPFDPRTIVSDNESESSGIEDLMSRATRERNASLAHAGPPSGRSMTKISEFGEKLKPGSLAVRFASDSFRTADTRPPQRERLSSSSLSQRPSHARGDISLARSKSTPITRPLAEDKQTTVKLVTRRSGRVTEAADAMPRVLPFTHSHAPSTFDKPLPAPPTLERVSAYVQNGEPLPGPLIGDGFVLNEENVRRARDLERERCQQWDEIIAQSVDAAAAGNPRTGRRSPHRAPSHDILAAHSPYMTWEELLPAPSGIPEVVRIDSPEPELDSEPEFDSIDLPLHSHSHARSSTSLHAQERNRTRSPMPPRSYSSPSGAGRHPIDPVTHSSPAHLESQRSCPPVPNSAASSHAAKARRGVPSAVKHPRNTHTSVQQPRPDYYGDANIAKRAAELKQIAEKDAEYQRWQRQYEEDKRFRQELALAALAEQQKSAKLVNRIRSRVPGLPKRAAATRD